MAEVMAGFVCGFALSLIVTPLAAIAIVRTSLRSIRMQQVVPEGTRLVAVSVILHGFAFLAMTAIGIVLGLLLAGIEDRTPAGGLGSPNGLFTTLILVTTVIAVVPIAAIMSRWRVPLLAGGLAFAICFGWAMPWLSLLGPEG